MGGILRDEIEKKFIHEAEILKVNRKKRKF